MKTENLQAALWDIVQWVAEMQVPPAKELDGVDCWTYCSFCDAFVSQDAQGKHPHEPNCKVTKARELIKQRELQQSTNPVTIHVELDGKVIAEHISTVDVRELLKKQQEKEKERRILLDMAYRNCEE